jgi:hypothetical protein
MSSVITNVISVLKGFIGFTRSFNTVADASSDKWLRVGQKVSIDERDGAIFSVVLSVLVIPDGFGVVQCVNNADLALDLVINSNTHVRFFGVKGDGLQDDTLSLCAAWRGMLESKSKIFNAYGGYVYRLSGEPRYITSVGIKCFFSTSEVDGVELKNGESKFLIDPVFGQGITVLFESRGTDGFSFDNIIGEVPFQKAAAGDSTLLLQVTFGAKASCNTVGNLVRGKNTGGVAHNTNNGDYAANGFESIYRPYNTSIDSIIIDNEEMPFTFANEFTSYGLTCSLSGDNTYVRQLIVNNIHRGIFLYGVKGVTVASGKITESNATTVNIGGYGSVIDININVSVVQHTNLATELTRIKLHEVGTVGGGSLELLNGRTHIISGIELNLAISGRATSNETGFGLNKTTGSGLDSSIEIRDINLSIRNLLSGVSRSFSIFNLVPLQKCQNMRVSGITLNKSIVLANATINMPPNLVDDIVVDGFIGGGSLKCGYGDLIDINPPSGEQIILNNVNLKGTISPSGEYDCPVTVRDSKISETIHVNGNVPAFNKTFINSYLGGKYIEFKGRYDVYTNVADSSSMFSPDYPLSSLAMGGSISAVNSTPLNLDLTAPSSNKSDVFANLYREGFVGNSTHGAANPLRVKILVGRAGSSGFGVATGVLIAYGVSANSFGAATFKLGITSVINTGGQAFDVADFSVSVLDDNTIRFSCARESSKMYVSVQR